MTRCPKRQRPRSTSSSRCTTSPGRARQLGFTELLFGEKNVLPPVPQRLVRTHPGSRRKTLYVAAHASEIVGWPLPDGRLLLRELIEHATQREFVYRHEWREGDLVIWDNRCTMHRGRHFDESRVRDLRRVTTRDIGSTLDQVAPEDHAAITLDMLRRGVERGVPGRRSRRVSARRARGAGRGRRRSCATRWKTSGF